MRCRALGGVLAVSMAAVCVGLFAAGPAGALTNCTWAGTPLAPTGTFTLTPGLTNFPAPAPLAFRATGELGGPAACGTGTMTFLGQADAGSSCLNASFEGVVQGLPGVVRFWGKGPGAVVPSYLYDSAGRVVGVENAELFTQSNFFHTTDCATPTGFTGGWPDMFSSTFVLFDR